LSARRRLWILAGVVAALVAISAVVKTVGNTGDGGGAASATPSVIDEPKGPATGGVEGAAPTRHIGPQGRTGQFVVHCTYSHSGPNDPIVHYGMAGMSHRHDFYGPDDTDQSSTPEELLESHTTCDKVADTAAYWHPTLYDRGKIVEPQDLSAYYRAAPGVDPDEVEPFPFGMALLAGDQTATTPQPGEAAGWACGTDTHLSDDPPTCEPSAPLHLVLTYPDCWDGEHLDSEDHVSHATYSDAGTCPDGYPVHLPQLTLAIRFPISGEGHELTLASGNIYSAHGDFFNAWEPEGLAREIDGCIKRDVVCDLASNREEEALFSYAS